MHQSSLSNTIFLLLSLKQFYRVFLFLCFQELNSFPNWNWSKSLGILSELQAELEPLLIILKRWREIKVQFFSSWFRLRDYILTKVYSGFWSIFKTSISYAVNALTFSSGVYFIGLLTIMHFLLACYNSLGIWFLWFWQETHVKQAIHFCQWLVYASFRGYLLICFPMRNKGPL